jgi:hypothetical protein
MPCVPPEGTQVPLSASAIAGSPAASPASSAPGPQSPAPQDELFKKDILKPTHAIEFGFCAHHSMTLQCLRLANMTLNLDKMFTAVIFLDTEKALNYLPCWLVI